MSADLEATAARVRGHVVQMAATPEGCHLGGSLSSVDILTALYFAALRLDGAPAWSLESETFVLSKGHASAALYATLAERGFLEGAELAGYGQWGGRLAGHPLRRVPGVSFATGSLGHGLSLGIGVALADRLAARALRTFVLLGDGELQEGTVWEAARTASRFKLDTLTAIVDCNGLQINGATGIRAEGVAEQWQAFGWTARVSDGHDVRALAKLFAAMPLTPGRPSIVVARTVKAKGVAQYENRIKGHYVKLPAAPAGRPAQVERVGDRR